MVAARRRLRDVVALAGTAAVQKALPAIATYVAAMGLLASALVMWWWTEGTFDR